MNESESRAHSLLARLRYLMMRLEGGTYQESCPLGVLELRTSMQLTSI
jgi:hypothetical protein